MIGDQHIAIRGIKELILIVHRHVGNGNVTRSSTDNVAAVVLRIQWVFENIEIETAETPVLVIDHQAVFAGILCQKIASCGDGIPGTGIVEVGTVGGSGSTTAVIQLFPDNAVCIRNIDLNEFGIV